MKLPGMVQVDKNVSSGLRLTARLSNLLTFSSGSFVKILLGDTQLDGQGSDSQGMNDSRGSPYKKLSKVRSAVRANEAGLFVIFGSSEQNRQLKKCLLVSFVPDSVPVRNKMILASSKGSIKNEISQNNPGVIIEEYNCTELKEISQEAYLKIANAAKPFSEAELQLMEELAAEEEMRNQADQSLASKLRNSAAIPRALPGFGLGMKPSELKRMRAVTQVVQQKDQERERRVQKYINTKVGPTVEIEKESAEFEDLMGALEPSQSSHPTKPYRPSNQQKYGLQNSSQKPLYGTKLVHQKPRMKKQKFKKSANVNGSRHKRRLPGINASTTDPVEGIGGDAFDLARSRFTKNMKA